MSRAFWWVPDTQRILRATLAHPPAENLVYCDPILNINLMKSPRQNTRENMCVNEFLRKSADLRDYLQNQQQFLRKHHIEKLKESHWPLPAIILKILTSKGLCFLSRASFAFSISNSSCFSFICRLLFSPIVPSDPVSAHRCKYHQMESGKWPTIKYWVIITFSMKALLHCRTLIFQRVFTKMKNDKLNNLLNTFIYGI